MLGTNAAFDKQLLEWINGAVCGTQRAPGFLFMRYFMFVPKMHQMREYPILKKSKIINSEVKSSWRVCGRKEEHRSAKCGPCARSGLSSFCKQGLLEPTCAYLFMYCLWLLLHHNSVVNRWDRAHMAPKAQNISYFTGKVFQLLL